MIGLLALVLLVLSPACSKGKPPADIFAAALNGDLNRVQTLVAENPDLVNAQNQSGLTPLHLAAIKGQVAIAEFLLQKGADPNLAEANGDTPLHFAASYGYVEIVRSLLEHGAKVNLRNLDGKTALSRGRPGPAIAELLKRHGGVE